MKILVINGPNLNLLGSREPHVYGHRNMADCLAELRRRYPDIEIEYYQSNHEGDIIDRLHKASQAADCKGVVLNAGAYTHTSLAIADAVAAIAPLPVVEVHISNTAAREPIRHVSLIAPVAAGVISGLGLDVYRLAVEAIKEMK